jgi:hypothetical protein
MAVDQSSTVSPHIPVEAHSLGNRALAFETPVCIDLRRVATDTIHILPVLDSGPSLARPGGSDVDGFATVPPMLLAR